jgi:hypothetical protein
MGTQDKQALAHYVSQRQTVSVHPNEPNIVFAYLEEAAPEQLWLASQEHIVCSDSSAQDLESVN